MNKVKIPKGHIDQLRWAIWLSQVDLDALSEGQWVDLKDRLGGFLFVGGTIHEFPPSFRKRTEGGKENNLESLEGHAGHIDELEKEMERLRAHGRVRKKVPKAKNLKEGGESAEISVTADLLEELGKEEEQLMKELQKLKKVEDDMEVDLGFFVQFYEKLLETKLERPLVAKIQQSFRSVLLDLAHPNRRRVFSFSIDKGEMRLVTGGSRPPMFFICVHDPERQALLALARLLTIANITGEQIQLCPECKKMFVIQRHPRNDIIYHCSIRCARLAATRRYRERRKREEGNRYQIREREKGTIGGI